MQIIQSAYDGIPAAGQSLETILKDEGSLTAAACATIAAVYYLAIQWFLAGQPKLFMVNFFNILIRLGLALLLTTTSNGLARDIFVNASTEVSKKFAANADNPTEIIKISFDTIKAIANGTERSAQKSEACLLAENGDILNPLSWFFNTKPEACKAKEDIGLFDIVKYLPVILVTLVCQALAIIATGLMALAFIAVTLISKIVVEVGLIIAPILIGLSVLPYLNYLLDSWIRYLITAALIPIINWIMSVFMMKTLIPSLTSTLEKLNQAAPDAETYFANNEMTMIAIAILASLGAYLIWQVPQIAAALVAGGGTGTQTHSFGSGFVGRTVSAAGNKMLNKGGGKKK